MAKLTIDVSGKNGLAPRFWGDLDRTQATPELRYLGKDGQMADGIWNPFRKYGYLSSANASFSPATSSGTYNNIIGSTQLDIINEDFYLAERGPQLFVNDGLDASTNSVAVDLGSTGTPVIMDLEIYQVNSVRKLFVVYEKSDYIEIAISSLPYNTSTDDLTWLSATVANPLTSQGITNNAFMRVADNGFAYLFMDNQVHKIDGTAGGGANGTITANVLLFPNNFQLTDAVDDRGLMFIALRQDKNSQTAVQTANILNSEVGVYVWDRQSTVINTRDFYPLRGIKEIRKIYNSVSGKLRLIVVNSERITQIMEFTGSGFKTIEEVGLNSYPQFNDSVANFSNGLVWLGIDGTIYFHGSAYPTESENIYKIGSLAESIATGVSTGAILYCGSNADAGSGTGGYKTTKNGIILSYINASNTKLVKEWDMYGTGGDRVTATCKQGDIYTLVSYLPKLSTVNYIYIYCTPTTTGATQVGTVKVYFNQSSTPWASKVFTLTDTSKGYMYIPVDKNYINAIQLEFEFGTDINVSFGFSPNMAIVDYTPTETNK